MINDLYEKIVGWAYNIIKDHHEGKIVDKKDYEEAKLIMDRHVRREVFK